jgi:hypothetical protein
MKLQANFDLFGSYGVVRKHQMFEVESAYAAQELIRNGRAREPDAPTITYSTKMFTPEQPQEASQAATPFRIDRDSNAQPARLYRAGSALRPCANPAAR